MLRKILCGIGLILAVVIVIFTKLFFVNVHSDNTLPEISLNVVETKVENDISSVVEKISNLVAIGDIASLENYVTKVPESYKQKRNESLRRFKKMGMETFKKQMTRQPGTFVVNPYPSFSDKKEQVEFAVPFIKEFAKEEIKFIKIINIRQNEDEGRALVAFGYKNSMNTEYEVLLYRVEGKWKFFRFSYPDRWADLYAEENANLFNASAQL